ncbi:MAG: helix-turn-helix domain-containing protein [Clostridia bacterium]|nr:helix-turn-helix domain-containing protein [Clostridia bacterium]
MESIGKRISALRKDKGLSQEELAEALFVSRQTVSKWERGQSLPDADNITAMCAFLNVSADELLGCQKPCVQSEAVKPEAAQPQNTVSEKPAKMKLWLKILIISVVCFFALLGVMCTIVFVFALTVDDDPVILTRVVPMVCIMAAVIFAIVTGVVIALSRKGKNTRN